MVNLTRLFLILGKVNLDEQINILERFYKGDNYIIHIYKTFMALSKT